MGRPLLKDGLRGPSPRRVFRPCLRPLLPSQHAPRGCRCQMKALRAMPIDSPTPPTGPLPRPLLRFVELFDREEFWESHEVLEDAWRESRSGFFHGLILYASAFVHVQRGNPRGVVAQLRKAERALTPFEPAYLGVDVGGILRRAGEIRARIGKVDDPTSEEWTGEITFPKLPLEASRVLGTEPELALLNPSRPAPGSEAAARTAGDGPPCSRSAAPRPRRS